MSPAFQLDAVGIADAEVMMQVVILCGGQGTRIRDVADDLPKPMIPIGGRPIIWHIMKGYAQFGVRDFVLCLGYKGWEIKRHFLDCHLADSDLRVCTGASSSVEVIGNRTSDDWNVTLAETGLDAMTGCRIKRIEQYITGDEFMLTYGDGVSNVDINELIRFHRRHGKVGTVTAVRAPGRFGELELASDQVVDFSEKPLVAPGRISGGFFVFQREIFNYLRNDPKLIFEQAPLNTLARDGELHAYEHDGFWHPMDSSRDYNYLNQLWNAKNAPWNTWDGIRLRAVA